MSTLERITLTLAALVSLALIGAAFAALGS
jgi:hypothetical protein